MTADNSANNSTPGSHHFEMMGSELLLDAPILAVRRDKVRMPGGAVANREIVEHFGAVAVVAFDGEKIAMVKQYRHCVRDRLWELPAGILDIADEDPLVCAKRELLEEAGLEARSWELLSDHISSPGFCEEVIRIFLARDLHDADRPEPEDEEADMQLEWFDLHEARDMVLRGEINNGIAMSGIMMAAHVIDNGLAGRAADTPFVYRPTSMPERRKAAGNGADMKKL